MGSDPPGLNVCVGAGTVVEADAGAGVCSGVVGAGVGDAGGVELIVSEAGGVVGAGTLCGGAVAVDALGEEAGGSDGVCVAWTGGVIEGVEVAVTSGE